ncbi:MAG: ABC transporter ATP-binding protein [Eubacteriaceae bacterium]|nr:ABC transporter ATP-binding protein [Eubacteriaceae bacterium]
MSGNALTVEKLTKSFGGITAVSNVTLHIGKGELVGLIGPNGAGKTTLFNLLTGVYAPTSGDITAYLGEQPKSMRGMPPHKISRVGIARTFQNIRLFSDLSVLDNVRIAMHNSIEYGFAASFFHTKRYFEKEAQIKEQAIELLGIFGLDKKTDELARSLPYGEQRHLEIVRALATKPEILLLDEPAAGMNQSETLELAETISAIKSSYGLSVFLIEHDMSVVMSICERIYVLDYGVLIADGTPEEIRSNKKVIAAYLGEEKL